MNTTARHIAHLLPHISTLEVCGLGTFTAIHIPAAYSPAQHTLTPPVDGICFDSMPVAATSQVLVESVRRGLWTAGEKPSQAECEAVIASDVAEMMSTLRCGLPCQIGEAGTLTAVGGNIRFEESDAWLSASATSWLVPLELKPLVAEVSPARAAASYAETSRRQAIARSLKIASSWAAAIVVFAVVAFVTAWVNRLDGDSEATMASTMPAAHSSRFTADNVQTQPLVLVFRTPADGVAENPPKSDRQPNTEAADKQHTTQNTQPSNSDGPYFLIVASLANAAEAQAYIDAHTTASMPLRVVEMQGRYRVSAWDGGDVATVAREARQAGVYDVYPNAWVCRR